MTWLPLLLADPSPSLRWLVLRDLLGRADDDPEVRELVALRERDALVAPLLAAQAADGAWRGDLTAPGGSRRIGALPRAGEEEGTGAPDREAAVPDPDAGGTPGSGAAVDERDEPDVGNAVQDGEVSIEERDARGPGDGLRATLLALMRLGYLGFDAAHPAVARGAAYLFSLQREDGAWAMARSYREQGENEGYSMVPLQTALPLRALAMCGYATDPRTERAYAWLLAQRLSDGGWPTGIAGGGTYGYVAGYRKLPHSRWGCRSNTTGALLCLAHHPERRHSPEARRALDLLLGRETHESSTLGFDVARLIGAEPARGFMTFYGRFDLAQILDLCRRVGATRDDPRVAELVDFVGGLLGPYGLWDITPPQATRWVSFELLRSLSRLDESGDWISQEPRTPFQTYPKRPRRY